MSLAAKVAKNTIYQIVGKGAGVILGLLTVAIMTRYLGQTGFGYYTAIIAFLQFFGVVVDFGLQMTTSQLLGRPGADENSIFRNVLALRLVSAAAFMGLAVAVVWFLPYPDIVKAGVTVTSVSFFFIALQSVYVSVFQKHMEMATVAWGDVLGRLVLLVGVWFFAATSRGLLFIMAAIVLGSLANFLVLHVRARRHVIPGLAFDRARWKEIISMSWPLAITISLSLIYFRADTLVLSFVRPAEEVGIYGAAYKVIDILTQFPYLFLGLLLPIFAKFVITNREIFKSILQKTFDFMAIATVPLVLGGIVLGDKVMLLIAGPEFAVSGALLKILIVAVGVIYFGSFFGYSVVSVGEQKKMIKFYLIDAVISLGLYIWLIPIYSYWAAAILTVFAELLITLPAFFILRRNLGSGFRMRVFGKALIAGLVMAAVLQLLLPLNVIALVVIGFIVYVAALLALRGVDRQSVMDIVRYRNG